MLSLVLPTGEIICVDEVDEVDDGLMLRLVLTGTCVDACWWPLYEALEATDEQTVAGGVIRLLLWLLLLLLVMFVM